MPAQDSPGRTVTSEMTRNHDSPSLVATNRFHVGPSPGLILLPSFIHSTCGAGSPEADTCSASALSPSVAVRVVSGRDVNVGGVVPAFGACSSCRLVWVEIAWRRRPGRTDRVHVDWQMPNSLHARTLNSPAWWIPEI